MATVKGGAKLEKKLAEIGTNLARADRVAVGFLENATYPDGTPVAMVAAIQDGGAPRAGIPPRPFFRNMIRIKSPEWGPAVGALLIANNFDADATLRQAGEAIAGQLRESIIETNTPPLAESTLEKRGVPGMVYDPKNPKTFRAKPLVDTGHMLASVDLEVRRRR